MSDMPGLEFDLGEMADTIRDTTERFARDKIAPIAAEIDEKDEFPRAALAADGRARPARHHRRGGMWRARPRLSRACRRPGGSGARLGLGRPQLRRALATCASTRSAAGRNDEQKTQISAQADQRRACRRAGDERGGRRQRRRLDEIEGREDRATATASTAPNSGSPTAPTPTCWSSMPRPAKAASGITTFLIEKGMEGFSIGQKVDKLGHARLADRRAGVRGLLRPRRQCHGPGEWRRRRADERARL